MSLPMGSWLTCISIPCFPALIRYDLTEHYSSALFNFSMKCARNQSFLKYSTSEGMSPAPPIQTMGAKGRLA